MTREFVQLSQFVRQWKDLGCDDDDLRELEEFLSLRPDHGDVVIGTACVFSMSIFPHLKNSIYWVHTQKRYKSISLKKKRLKFGS